MTTKTLSRTTADTQLPIIAGVALTGVFLIFFAGFAQSAVFHDAAHDARHAIAFPCH